VRKPMSDICTEYRLLFNRFLAGTIPVAEFQAMYLDRFKNEKRWLGDELYELLESVFGDVDSFSTDPELLTKNPDFYLDERTLREKIQSAATRLSVLEKA
jgi:hypothetical protein